MNNGIIEKYCYNNIKEYRVMFMVAYTEWDEVMYYTLQRELRELKEYVETLTGTFQPKMNGKYLRVQLTVNLV